MTAALAAGAQTGSSSLHRVLLVLVLALSAFVQFTVVSRTEVNNPLRADAGTYFSYAYNLKNFGAYSSSKTWSPDPSGHVPALVRDAMVTPGYPLFLLAVGNPEPNLSFVRRVVFVQAALGVCSVLLMYLISIRFLMPALALGATLLTALSPHLAVMSAYVLTESLFVFLLFAAILSSILALESRRWPQFALAGLLWGFCSLVRPTVLFLPALLLLAVVALPKLRQFLQQALLGIVCFLAVQAPWQFVSHNTPPMPGQPSLMVNFLNFGSYPDFMYQGRPESYGVPYRYDPDSANIQRNLPSFLESIISRVRSEPATYARWYLIGKPGFFLSWTNIDGVSDIFVYPIFHSPYLEDNVFARIRIGMLLLHWPLMLLGLLGALLVFLRPAWAGLSPSMRISAGLLSLVFAYALAFHMVGAPLPRYGIPFRPLMFALAMLPLRSAWRALRPPVPDRI